MAAILAVASGTWSAFNVGNATGQGPGAVQNEILRVHRDTTEMRGELLGQRGLNYRADFNADVDGEQELSQFVGLWSVASGVPTRVLWARVLHLAGAVFGAGSETPEQQRIYAP